MLKGRCSTGDRKEFFAVLKGRSASNLPYATPPRSTRDFTPRAQGTLMQLFGGWPVVGSAAVVVQLAGGNICTPVALATLRRFRLQWRAPFSRLPSAPPCRRTRMPAVGHADCRQ